MSTNTSSSIDPQTRKLLARALKRRHTPSMAANLAPKLQQLAKFTACDVSDALLKLKVPGAGFLADMRHLAPTGVTSDRISLLPTVCAPASTVLFVPKSASDPKANPSIFHNVLESNIPPSSHYVDLTKPDTIVVMSQPEGQKCAVLGGIMALRMKKRGAKGIVVGGRIRDMTELKGLHVPIWSTSTSTVGAGAEAKPWALDVPIEVQGIQVHPGDIVVSDPTEGVVVIPQDKLDKVLELIPRLTEADDKVKEDVQNGATVKDSFAKHRSNL